MRAKSTQYLGECMLFTNAYLVVKSDFRIHAQFVTNAVSIVNSVRLAASELVQKSAPARRASSGQYLITKSVGIRAKALQEM